jgi:DNA-binding transcriptional LysR family regulator
MDVDLALLRLLIEIDRTGSMTAAAESLAYTPSAVSQQVKRLESAVGATVVERHARGVRLTDAGRVVLARALAVDTQLSALRSELDDLAGAKSGRVTLGVFPTFAASHLPEVMASYRGAHPGVTFGIRSGRLRDLDRMLHAREVDLALMWDYPETALSTEDLVVDELTRDPTVLLAPKGRDISLPITLRSLADEQWVVRSGGHPITAVFKEACRRSGFEPNVLIEANDYMEAQAMVAAGLGLSTAPQMTTHYLRDDVAALPTAGALPDRRVLLVRLDARQPSPAAEALTSILRHLV